MSEMGLESARPVSWPSNGISEVPFRLYTDPEQYALEQERIFRGPSWSYLCLASEVQNPGDWVATTVGEVAVIVTRGNDGAVNAFVNRCAHRGNLLCLTRQGHGKEITCIYHGWSYDLEGRLTGVAFEKGVKRQGGMAPAFRKEEHHLQRLRVAELCGLVFGTFDEDVEDLEAYLGPLVVGGLKRVLNRPFHLIGRSTQILPNNWKLYFENVKDTYHATLLHTFFTTFRLSRLTTGGGVEISDDGGHHASISKNKVEADAAESDQLYAGMPSMHEDFRLADPGFLQTFEEFGDDTTTQILSVFPNLVLQQINNSIALRLILPKGPDQTELLWIYLGFEEDDAAMTERRLQQANLVGPAGYVSMEDGAVGGFVQRAIKGSEGDCSVLEMGGFDHASQQTRTTEASVRGFWHAYRGMMGL